MASSGVSLDEIDERLLTLLRDDARQTIAQLAKELTAALSAAQLKATVKPGEGDLILAMRRPWENKAEPDAEKFTVTLKAK